MADDLLSEEALSAFFEDEKKRLALQRQAKDLEDKNASLKQAILDFVREHGGRDRTTVRHGFVLAIKTRAGFPDYKGEFLKLAGTEAAEQLRKAAKPIESLSIERIAS